MDVEGETGNSIVEIHGTPYLIPTVIKEGCLILDHSKRIKLPIPITQKLHINYASPTPPPKITLTERFIKLLVKVCNRPS